MNNRSVQLALREWQAQLRNVPTIVSLISIGCVLGVAAPFETSHVMRLVPRCAYWCVTVFGCYAWGGFVDALMRQRFGQHLPWVFVVLSGLITGLGVTLFVTAMNAFAFGFVPSASEIPGFVLTIMAISMIVTLALSYISRSRPDPTVGIPHTKDVLPPILDRLPIEKRGALVALSVEDHYVRVQTKNGEELLLMRLSDAVKEIGSSVGDQVHRSHWAGFEHVKAVERDGARVFLTMTTGARIPVSRANMPKLKAAGLLPVRT
ncbi:MAG: LytTR family DNA-binding domain-containing protein [Paracoccaceae bacterium]